MPQLVYASPTHIIRSSYPQPEEEKREAHTKRPDAVLRSRRRGKVAVSAEEGPCQADPSALRQRQRQKQRKKGGDWGKLHSKGRKEQAAGAEAQTGLEARKDEANDEIDEIRN